MKATLTAIIALLLGLAALQADAGETERRLENRMKKDVEQVSQTLSKYDAFKDAQASETGRQARYEMLHRVARRMRQNAEQLARSAEMLETQLLIESAEQPSEETELKTTQKEINELRKEIKELSRKLAAQKTDQEIAALK